MTNTPEGFLTVKQVQLALDVSNACLHTWRSLPEVGPPWIKEKGRFLYPVEQFEAYLLALTGGVPVPKGLGHKAKIEMFSRLPWRRPSHSTSRSKT